MNINTTNGFFASGLILGYPYIPMQLPDILIRNNITLVNHSGSQNTIYIGGSGTSWRTGMPIFVNHGLTVPADNSNLIFAVTESGYNADLRFSIN